MIDLSAGRERDSLPGRSLSSRRTHRVVVTGSRAGGTLGRVLAEALGGAGELWPDPAMLEESARVRLAVGIFEDADADREVAFAEWARRASLRALGVVRRTNEVLVGPIALPGRPGCGRCAWERRRAASAGHGGPLREQAAASGARRDAESTDELDAEVAGPALVAEVRAILRGGARAKRLVGHVLAIDTTARRWSLHRVIPTARCAVCGGMAAAAPAPGPIDRGPCAADEPEALLASLAGWVDPKVGVVSGLTVQPIGAAAAGLWVATAAPPHVVEPDGSLRRLPIGWGKGRSVSAAILSAVGEAIERYSPSLPDPDRVVWARPAELDGEFLDPRSCALYRDRQYARPGFPYARFDPGIRHPWVQGSWLGSGEPVWVPAVMTYLALTVAREHLVCQGTSSGLAAGPDLDDAALRATLELVERDAFLVAWRCGVAATRVDVSEDAELGGLSASLEAIGLAVELYALPTSACGTTALCLGRGDGVGLPGTTLGLAADLDPRRALLQAMLELAQTAPHLGRMMRTGALAVPREPSEVRELMHHAAYWFPRERAGAFDRLRGGGAVRAADLAAGAENRGAAGCASALAAAGVRVAVVDVSAPDVASGPFRVVRAVGPDLQPLDFGHGLERAPVERALRLGPAAPAPEIHPIW